MSGFLAILNLDGAPVEPELLGRMAAALAARGPDALRTWTGGQIGLGHTELYVAEQSQHGRQACTLDGRTWITGDVRIDGRQDLIGRLIAAGRQATADASDAELVLHAYDLWQDECASRLLGDFAFAIWDSDRRRLFCACDHFGVKPLYYACTSATLIVSNSIPAILAHPDVSAEHHELAIADFLLFGRQQDPENTVYSGIKCLPAAHTLGCTAAGRVATRRYWSVPADGHIRYRRKREYVEHFADLLTAAVRDRLPPDRAAVFMSGGLDSTSIAAVAQECSSRRAMPCQLSAHTMTYQGATGAEEGRLARLAAQAIDVPIDAFDGSSFQPFANWQSPDWLHAEPSDLTFAEANRQFVLRLKSTGARVVLTGQGGDPLLATTKDLFWNLLRGLRLPEIASYLGLHLWNYRRLPPLILRSRLMRHLRPASSAPFPDWIDSSFSETWGLKERWRRAQSPQPHLHPTRPEAHAGLDPVFWQWNFRRADAAFADLALEARHPLLDVRLVEFLLAIPPSPWFLEKSILREAMSGKLPEIIRRRPKCPAAEHPVAGYQRRHPGQLLEGFTLPDGIENYVGPAALRDMAAGSICCQDREAGIRLRCLSLAVWLNHAGGKSAERGALHDATC